MPTRITFEVETSDYNTFYDRLTQELISKEYKRQNLPVPDKNSKSFWTLMQNEKGQSIPRLLFYSHAAKSASYFWGVKERIVANGKKILNCEALVKALNYMEYSLEEYEEGTRYSKEAAEKLWAKFLKSTKRSILEILEEPTSFDANQIDLSKYKNFKINPDEKKELYKCIFDNSMLINRRLNAFTAFIVDKVLTDDEIINLFHISTERVLTDIIEFLPAIISKKNNAEYIFEEIYRAISHRQFDIKSAIMIFDSMITIDFKNSLYPIASIIRSFPNRTNEGSTKLLEGLTSIFWNNYGYSVDQLQKDELADIILVLKMRGVGSSEINMFKFVLARKHADIYNSLKSYIRELLGDDDIEYDSNMHLIPYDDHWQ